VIKKGHHPIGQGREPLFDYLAIRFMEFVSPGHSHQGPSFCQRPRSLTRLQTAAAGCPPARVQGAAVARFGPQVQHRPLGSAGSASSFRPRPSDSTLQRNSRRIRPATQPQGARSCRGPLRIALPRCGPASIHQAWPLSVVHRGASCPGAGAPARQLANSKQTGLEAAAREPGGAGNQLNKHSE